MLIQNKVTQDQGSHILLPLEEEYWIIKSHSKLCKRLFIQNFNPFKYKILAQNRTYTFSLISSKYYNLKSISFKCYALNYWLNNTNNFQFLLLFLLLIMYTQ